MRIHVLTAVTRPIQLPQLATSLAVASMRAEDVQVSWHWRYDLDLEHVGGQACKNEMLDSIHDGWVWILDDDTTVHHELFARVEHETRNPDVRGVVVSQDRGNGYHLPAHPDNVQVGGIDAGQAILRRDIIADHRLAPNYEGDGHWLAAILSGRDDIVYLREPLSLYNALEATHA